MKDSVSPFGLIHQRSGLRLCRATENEIQMDAGQLFKSQYISDFTGREMLDHLSPTSASVPGYVFSVTNCNPRPISFPWELIGFAMVAPFSLRLVSEGAAISLTPTDRYDNVHWLYCRVTAGQHNTHTHHMCSLPSLHTVPLCSFSALLVWRGPQRSLSASGQRLCLLIFKYFNITFLL